MEPSENMLATLRLKAGSLAERPVIAVAVATVTLLFAATLALWVHYGTAVFYEMILAGLAACI